MKTQGTPYRRRFPIEGNFDAIVVGSGMGGLSVASILAQQGQRILLLEQHNVIGGLTQSYERAGYRWTVGLHYIGDVGVPNTLTYKLFDYVAAGGIHWAPMPNIFNRVYIGDREYRIPSGVPAFRAALVKWFPDEAQAIDRYFELVQRTSKASAPFFAQKALPESMNIPGTGDAISSFMSTTERVTLDVLRDLTANEDLIGVLCANWGDYGLEPSRSSFAMHAMLAKHYLNGGSYPAGGGKAFADSIVPIIEAAGGQVLHSAEVVEIMVKDGATCGVRLISGEEIPCATVISNAGVRNSFGRLLREEVRNAFGLKAKLAQVTDTYAVVGLNIGLDGSAAELQLDPANIWYHPSNTLVENVVAHKDDFETTFPWTFITFPSAKDPNWDVEFPGKSTIEMYAYTNFIHFEQWAGTRWMKRGDDYEQRKRQIEQRLLADLYRLVPQVEGRVRHVEVSTPLSYETFVKRQRGDFMGVESSPQRFRQDWLRARTPIDGLYLTGQDVSTDGVIGALVGGVIAASALLGKDMMTEIRLRDTTRSG